MVKFKDRPEQPKSSFTVTEASGYTIEEKGQPRTANGWGGNPSRLPPGHLARRDTEPRAKNSDEYTGSRSGARRSEG